MDLRTAVIITALVLTTADAFNLTRTSIPVHNQTDNCICSSDNKYNNNTAMPPTTNHTPPVVGFLTISWTYKCEGGVILYHPSNSSHVCYNSEPQSQTLLTSPCQNRKGCKGPVHLFKGQNKPRGYVITEGGAEQRTSCDTLMVKCTVEVPPDFQGQLRTYKVITALLFCVLVVIFLCRFTRPTVKALQKRLSDRRQSRWIGPTQSHSVSYHRGKNVKNNDGEKRLSYPGLERLTVIDSREPSSNRNSGYNF